jgi:hypothetical protein
VETGEASSDFLSWSEEQEGLKAILLMQLESTRKATLKEV